MSDRWAGRLIGTVCVALVLLGGGLSLASLASAAPPGQVYLVQALAGTTADVLVDGSLVRAAATPKTVIGPLWLAAGQHVVRLRSGGSGLVSARFTVVGGGSLDVVAHRAADTRTTPVVTVFANDLSPVAPGKTRLVVSHVAVAEPADIRVDGRPFFRNVADGESLSLVVPARPYTLDVVATASGSRSILAPARVTLGAGTLTRVFAFGDPDAKTSDAIVQVLRVPVVGAGRPTVVHTGDGGQAAQQLVSRRTAPWPALVLGTGVLGLASVAGAAGGARRSLQVTGPRPPSGIRRRSRR